MTFSLHFAVHFVHVIYTDYVLFFVFSKVDSSEQHQQNTYVSKSCLNYTK